jgi:outer membrane autotransporter protein
MNIDGRLLGLYAQRLHDDTYVDLWAAVGRNSNDGARRIVFADIDRTAIGEYDTTYARLTGTLGRVYRVGERTTLTPTVTVGYTYARDASYTEKGAGDLNLRVDDNVSESFIAGVDGRLAYALASATTLTAHVGAGYRSFTDDASLNTTFVAGGPEFETAGASIEPYLVRAGVGAEYAATDRIEVQANYEYEYRGSFQDNLWTATLLYRI